MKVTAAKALEEYKVWLRFSDGQEGTVDLNDLAGRGVFAAWNDRSVFENLRIDSGHAVAWNGDIDLCSDALYLRLTGKPVDELFPALKTTSVDA